MTINQVLFASRELAESLVGNPYMAVISITDPGAAEAKLDQMFRHVLSLSFFDALPGEDYLPAPMPGLFDHHMAAVISSFVEDMHKAPFEISLMVHCECGVSRSAAVALFVEAYTKAAFMAREFTYEANQWVVEQLALLHPGMSIEIPSKTASHNRRSQDRD